MNKQRLGDMTDEVLDRDIARALAVDPSPEFVARVRARVAEEAAASVWRISWRMLCFAGGPILAAAILAAYVVRSRAVDAPVVSSVLTARPIEGTASVPYVTPQPLYVAPHESPDVESAFRRTMSGPAKAGRHVPNLAEARRHVPSLAEARRQVQGRGETGGRVLDQAPLLDAREMRALRSLIAGVRSNRVDLTPLLQPAGPAPMELPPVDDLVIAPIAIEPLAPQGGAQGERQ